MASKARINMNFPSELKQWLEQEADRNGFNLTTMIQVACMEYRKEQEALRFGQNVDLLQTFMEQFKQENN